MDIIPEVDEKDVNVANLAARVLENTGMLPGLLDGILANKDSIRFNSFKVLLLISEKHPEILYPSGNSLPACSIAITAIYKTSLFTSSPISPGWMLRLA